MTEKEFEQAKQECLEQMASVATFEGLKIERKGVWVWVSGNTRRHHVALKGAGFRFAPVKQMWYWKPKWVKSKSKGGHSMDFINNAYEGETIFGKEDAA